MERLAQEIYQLDSGQLGPTVLILGGVHGNETPGIKAVRHLMQEFTAQPHLLKAGRLILGLGNLRAIELNQRGSLEHADMNRVFSNDILTDTSRTDYEVERAREIAPLIRSADLTIDLHSTNKPSDPMVIYPVATEQLRQLAGFFPADKILTDPDEVIAGATDVYAHRHGQLGLCYESGWINDPDITDRLVDSVKRVLAIQGMIDYATNPISLSQTTYQMNDPIILTAAGFNFAPGLGERSFQPFAKGTTIGHHGDQPLIAQYDGVILFPKVKELQKIGAPIGFLAKVVS